MANNLRLPIVRASHSMPHRGFHSHALNRPARDRPTLRFGPVLCWTGCFRVWSLQDCSKMAISKSEVRGYTIMQASVQTLARGLGQT